LSGVIVSSHCEWGIEMNQFSYLVKLISVLPRIAASLASI
jgi:hypothetical protein